MYIICIQQVDGVHSEDRSLGEVRATRARMRVVCTEERGEGDRDVPFQFQSSNNGCRQSFRSLLGIVQQWIFWCGNKVGNDGCNRVKRSFVRNRWPSGCEIVTASV